MAIPRRNVGGYHGETIDIRETLRRIEAVALHRGWRTEEIFRGAENRLICLGRSAAADSSSRPARNVYVSTGIHGDEPAGPLAALRLIEEDAWPSNLELWICPCLNPIGFTLNSRLNAQGLDLNRDYRDSVAEEIQAHIEWLHRQPNFDLCLLLHEDWESRGFYLYEQNPDGRPSLAEKMIERVSTVCPVDESEVIEERPAVKGIIRPSLDPKIRPKWPEAFFLITHKTRLSYTIEAPSEFAMSVRVEALVTAVRAALEAVAATA